MQAHVEPWRTSKTEGKFKMQSEQSKNQLAYTIKRAAELANLSVSGLYNAIRANQLRAVKCGRRTLIKHVDLEAFVDGLPAFHSGDAA